MINAQIVTMEHILIITAIVAAVLAIISIIFALKAMVEVRALQQSTHSVSWMPVNTAKQWADDDKKIKEINKESKEFYDESGF